MDPALAGLVGATGGALVGLMGGVISGWQQRLSEEQRWRNQRLDETWKEDRRSLLELTTLTSIASQSMAWLAWSASVKPLDDVKRESTRYDDQMRKLLPKIFGAQAAASSLSESAYTEVQILVRRTIELDTFIGTKFVEIDKDQDSTLALIAGLEEKSLALAHDIVATTRVELQSIAWNGRGPSGPHQGEGENRVSSGHPGGVRTSERVLISKNVPTNERQTQSRPHGSPTTRIDQDQPAVELT